MHAGGSGLRLSDCSELKNFKLQLVPGSLALDSNGWFSFDSAFQLFLAVESSSLFLLCIRLIFMFSEMLH